MAWRTSISWLVLQFGQRQLGGQREFHRLELLAQLPLTLLDDAKLSKHNCAYGEVCVCFSSQSRFSLVWQCGRRTYSELGIRRNEMSRSHGAYHACWLRDGTCRTARALCHSTVCSPVQSIPEVNCPRVCYGAASTGRDLCGTRWYLNVAAAAGERRPDKSVDEQVVIWNPDVILALDPASAGLPSA